MALRSFCLTRLSNGVRLMVSKGIRQMRCNKIHVLQMRSVIPDKGMRKRRGIMEQYKLGEMEQRFAELIWEHAPIGSGELTRLCEKAFSWKRTTTYTMLKRLCDRKLFANESGTVVVLMSREEFQAAVGEQFINETFNGSLPGFLAAFTRKRKLSDKEISELKKLIDSHEEGEA